VGRIGRPHGLHGEVTVDVRTDSPDERFAPGTALAAGERTLVVRSSRPHSGRLLVTFEQINDRDAAAQLRGALLTVDSAALPPTGDPDEFYDHQLEDLVAVRVDGVRLGTVREVVHAPAHDLLVVDTDQGEHLVPFVRAIVCEVDLAGGRVVIDPPEGLLGGPGGR
jgi:16S rRNA processing protein RimM